jgi:hypothetical protein
MFTWLTDEEHQHTNFLQQGLHYARSEVVTAPLLKIHDLQDVTLSLGKYCIFWTT